MSDYQGVCIFGEWTGEDIHEVTYELISEGRRLADELQVDLQVIFLGPPEARERVQELGHYGVDRVFAVLDPRLGRFRDDLYSRLVAEILREKRPEIVLFSATSLGQALAPRVAGLLRLGLTAHCVAFDIRPEDRALIQIRPSFGEDVMARIISRTKPQMATVRPGVFPRAQAQADRHGEVEELSLPEELFESALEIVETQKAPPKEVDLTKAKVIVAGGRGMGNKEFFAKLFELAELLEGAVGATRPVCHLGWISEDHMIGVSGVSVAPKLYLGFGISGALHHVVGLKGAETIVAINKDPEAPLMKKAHIAVQGDVREILPLLIQRLRGLKQSG